MLLVRAWDNTGQAPAGWGSHVVLPWREFEPKPGVYRLDLFEQALARRERSCYLQLVFSMYDKGRRVPVDYTPAHHKRSLKPTVDGVVGEIPPYDATWTAAYNKAVAALAGPQIETPSPSAPVIEAPVVADAA